MSLFYFLPDFITWWYGRGLQDYFNFLSVLFSYLMNVFSLKTIFRTFFAPWKKMVEKKGRGIDGFFNYLLDNMISRGVAIVMRLMLIFVFFMTMIFYFFGVVLATIFWFLMPALPVVAFFLLIGVMVW